MVSAVGLVVMSWRVMFLGGVGLAPVHLDGVERLADGVSVRLTWTDDDLLGGASGARNTVAKLRAPVLVAAADRRS